MNIYNSSDPLGIDWASIMSITEVIEPRSIKYDAFRQMLYIPNYAGNNLWVYSYDEQNDQFDFLNTTIIGDSPGYGPNSIAIQNIQ